MLKREFAMSLFVILTWVAGVDAQSDPKIVEAAKKEGGEIEAYVTLRTDTAQFVWKMFVRGQLSLLLGQAVQGR